MRKVSKVLLSIFSSLGIAIILFELFAIFFALLIMVIDVVFDIVLIVLISTNAVPADTISALYSFASITDPFKLILSFYGVTDTPEYMVGMLVGDMVICILRPIVSIIAIIPHLILVLVASILGFVGASKKAKKGTHLANVITGGFIALANDILKTEVKSPIKNS